jgi:hypothetical protein
VAPIYRLSVSYAPIFLANIRSRWRPVNIDQQVSNWHLNWITRDKSDYRHNDEQMYRSNERYTVNLADAGRAWQVEENS